MSSYHDNEAPVHQNGFDSSKSPLHSSQESPLSRNGKTTKQNGTNLSNKKTKKVPPQTVGKGSSNHHQVLAKSDSEDEATPISVSLQLLYFYSNWLTLYDDVFYPFRTLTTIMMMNWRSLRSERTNFYRVLYFVKNVIFRVHILV